MLAKASSALSTASSLLTVKTIERTRSKCGQQAMAAGLRQQFQSRVLPIQLAGIDQHDGCIGAGGGSHHVAGVLLVAGRVANDEFAVFGREIAVGHVDGDALLAFGGQSVGQQRQIRLARALHAGQVVLQHGFGVDQQAADQRAFAIIHAAAGDEFERALGVVLGGLGAWR